MSKQATCAERVAGEWASTRKDLDRLWRYEREGECTPDGERLTEYALGFDYVEPDTFEDQPEGYWRWQFSWGGPSDELRFHDSGRIEYWFLDWFDGASRDVTHDLLVQDLWEWLEPWRIPHN